MTNRTPPHGSNGRASQAWTQERFDHLRPNPGLRTLVAIPVFNEERYVSRVLARVTEYADDILVVDDGSTDRTPSLLTKFPVDVIRHGVNRGYGRSLRDAFDWAAMRGYDWVLTMDCDEQHEPAAIPHFLDRIHADISDVISGSRYLDTQLAADSESTPAVAASNATIAPPDRRRINHIITDEINQRLASAWPRPTHLTDAFCGFKAFRVPAVARLNLSQDGYAFPMQFWVQAAAARLRVEELPVKLIYNDPNRTFGGTLDDPAIRLAHYREVFEHELERCADRLRASNDLQTAGFTASHLAPSLRSSKHNSQTCSGCRA